MGNIYEFDMIAENIFKPIYPVIADEILSIKDIKDNGWVLDIGCGGGHLGLSLIEKSQDMNIVLLDKNPDACKITLERSKKLGLSHRSIVVNADVQNLPFPDKSFNLIISRGSMPFWTDYEKAFLEISRVLNDGGIAFIGGGFGNDEKIARSITEKMKKKDPLWPDNIKGRKKYKDLTFCKDLLENLGLNFEMHYRDDACSKFNLIIRK